MTQDIIKKYGDVIHKASSIMERKVHILSVSPKFDIALGGGVPEGSLFILTVCDISAVDQGIWNHWKSSLLYNLYLKTERELLIPQSNYTLNEKLKL